MFTKEQIEKQCLEDYEAYKGKIVLATNLYGMFDNDSREIQLDKPVRVRIHDRMDNKSIISQHDEWFDTNWDVELLEQHDELLKSSSLWIDGISRSTDGHGTRTRGWEIDPNQSLSREYIEQCCMSEYQKHAGKFLLAKRVFFTIDDNDVDFLLDRPIRVRVIPHIFNICTPFWDVEIAEPPFDNKTKYLHRANRIGVITPFMTDMGERDTSADLGWEIDPDQSRSPTKPTLRSSVSTTKICCPYCKNSIKIAISPIED